MCVFNVCVRCVIVLCMCDMGAFVCVLLFICSVCVCVMYVSVYAVLVLYMWCLARVCFLWCLLGRPAVCSVLVCARLCSKACSSMM